MKNLLIAALIATIGLSSGPTPILHVADAALPIHGNCIDDTMYGTAVVTGRGSWSSVRCLLAPATSLYYDASNADRSDGTAGVDISYVDGAVGSGAAITVVAPTPGFMFLGFRFGLTGNVCDAQCPMRVTITNNKFAVNSGIRLIGSWPAGSTVTISGNTMEAFSRNPLVVPELTLPISAIYIAPPSGETMRVCAGSKIIVEENAVTVPTSALGSAITVSNARAVWDGASVTVRNNNVVPGAYYATPKCRDGRTGFTYGLTGDMPLVGAKQWTDAATGYYVSFSTVGKQLTWESNFPTGALIYRSESINTVQRFGGNVRRGSLYLPLYTTTEVHFQKQYLEFCYEHA